MHRRGSHPAAAPDADLRPRFNSAGDYQSAVFNLGHAGTGWITADGFVPPVLPDGRAQLPDERVVWWRADRPRDECRVMAVLRGRAPAERSVELELRRYQANGVHEERWPAGRPPDRAVQRRPVRQSLPRGRVTWDTLSNDIRAWVSFTPLGPWEQQPATTATFQKRTNDQIAYDAHIVNLPGAGWTVVYSVNDPINQTQDFALYRGQFAGANGLPAP